MEKIAVFWFRRDLRLEDNTALHHALKSKLPVLPIFIFDPNIIGELPEDDARISFIYEQLEKIHNELSNMNSGLKILYTSPLDAWKGLISKFKVGKVFFNRDYEPYAIERDTRIIDLLESHGIQVKTFKDQVIFEKEEIVKNDGKPYTIFTPFKNKWLEVFNYSRLKIFQKTEYRNLYKQSFQFPDLKSLGFKKSDIKVSEINYSTIENYDKTRDFPSRSPGTLLGPHLRFGTVSIRKLIKDYFKVNQTFVSELIWREFFMQILYHFPHVEKENFRSKYDRLNWRNSEVEFDRWCLGQTGFPMVDAGMRQLISTGYMHNRIRMITANFLCKHLLIDWRWGESWFGKHLLDYELSSNNGNWQWAAGTGCDAAPYFRVFNPETQQKKFDPNLQYIKKWIPEFGTPDYPAPIIDHKMARERAIDTYSRINS